MSFSTLENNPKFEALRFAKLPAVLEIVNHSGLKRKRNFEAAKDAKIIYNHKKYKHLLLLFLGGKLAKYALTCRKLSLNSESQLLPLCRSSLAQGPGITNNVFDGNSLPISTLIYYGKFYKDF